jgi:hypothetical protein
VFNGTTWSTEVKVKSTLSSGPSCATLDTERVLCAARSSTGGLTSSIYNGSNWSVFDNQAANSTSPVSCASDDGGRVICAMLETTSSIIVNRYNGTAWEGFLNIAGRNTGNPVCADLGISGQVLCFGRGEDTALWGRRFNGGAWTLSQWGGWSSIGGLVGPKTSCGVITSSQVVCGVSAIDDTALWVNEFNGSGWLGWTRLGQTIVGTPSCTGLGNGKVLCAVVNVNNKVSSIVGP